MTIEKMIASLKNSSLPCTQEIIEALLAGQSMRESIRIVRTVGKSVAKIAEQPLIAAAIEWTDATANRDNFGRIIEDTTTKQTYEAWIAKVQDIALINQITLPFGDDLRSYFDEGISPIWYFEEDERVASQFGKTR
jgi:hypothetical protein